MDDGQGGGGSFQLTPPTPLCSQCGVRSARPHHAVGFWASCSRCSRQKGNRLAPRRTGRRRPLHPCSICGSPRAVDTPSLSGTCSTPCKSERERRCKASHKTRVLAALGNHCVCPGTACWHSGPCTIANPHLLEVDHTHNDGARVRRRLRSTSTHGTQGQWPRYARALELPDHGMQLLCANCHRAVTVARRVEKSKKSSRSV